MQSGSNGAGNPRTPSGLQPEAESCFSCRSEFIREAGRRPALSTPIANEFAPTRTGANQVARMQSGSNGAGNPRTPSGLQPEAESCFSCRSEFIREAGRRPALSTPIANEFAPTRTGANQVARMQSGSNGAGNPRTPSGLQPEAESCFSCRSEFIREAGRRPALSTPIANEFAPTRTAASQVARMQSGSNGAGNPRIPSGLRPDAFPVGANSFAKQAEGLPCKPDGAAAQPFANEFAPTRVPPRDSVHPTIRHQRRGFQR
ncbi:hypothetical protein D3C78_559390 [compost metagenome]